MENNVETTSTQTQSSSSGKKFLSAVGKFFKTIFNVVASLIKSLFAFFWALALGAKVTFLIILALAIVLSYWFGYNKGQDDKVEQIETQLETLKGNADQIDQVIENIRE
jgi:hypothetical protein